VRYYPVFLDIAGKPVVIIGGGEVALRKVEGLLDAGAQVTVVSPELYPELRGLVEEGRVRYEGREYRRGDLEGYALAFVASDDRSANAAVAREGRERGVWVNAVDDPERCDFIMPSIVQRGDFIVAISTSGGSPAMARKLREEMAGFLTDDYVLLLELATEVRRDLRQKGVLVDAEVWNAALDGGLRGLLAEGRRVEAKDRLVHSLLQPAREA
jgi:precorrin-2 dehydrogenase/sirohydrochlorin ferrochelatase